MEAMFAGFTESLGEGYGDPLYGKGSYELIEHEDEYQFVYLRPEDKAVAYFVESFPYYGLDIVYRFPHGLTTSRPYQIIEEKEF
jgi:hypothetical protein